MRFLVWGFMVLIGWLIAEWISLQIGISDGAEFDELFTIAAAMVISIVTMPRRTNE